ncbi:PAS domain-containing protein [Aureococcus anophagefferens]|nr:PAS domain-containing protein [Aureococcus anophagefferens]
MTALSGPTFGLEASEELDVMDGLFFNELSDLPVEPGSAKMYSSSGPQPVVDTPITGESSSRARRRNGGSASSCAKLGAEAAAPSLEYCAAQSRATATPRARRRWRAASGAINKYDYGLLEALKHARRSFVITDPTLPDNPIVFASGGFLSLTGYKLEQVLGRNCRFLQGPRTDARAVGKIREAIKHGTDVQICLLNYKIDSTTFWNHFFIAALRDGGGVVNFLGVQIEVSERIAMGILQNMDGKAADGKAAPAAAPPTAPPKAPAAVGASARRRRPMSAARPGLPGHHGEPQRSSREPAPSARDRDRQKQAHVNGKHDRPPGSRRRRRRQDETRRTTDSLSVASSAGTSEKPSFS